MCNLGSKKLWCLIALVAVFALVGCTGDSNDGGGATPAAAPAETAPAAAATVPPADEVEVVIAEELQEAFDALADLRALEAQFNMACQNPNPIIPGGIFQWARVQNTGFPGLFMPMFSSDNADSILGEILIYPLMGINDDGTFTQNGIVTWEYDLDALTVTMTMRDDIPTVYWHDGVELTLNDVVFTYYVVGHPEYTGPRFTAELAAVFVVGIEEFKAGEVDYIAGLVLSDDHRQLTIHYTQMPPSMLFNGILSTPLPRHFWEANGVSVADMPSHPGARDELLGFGPFRIERVVPGESVYLVANPNYWQGAPYLDGIVYQIVHPDIFPEVMRAGLVDYGWLRNPDWEDHNNMTNVQYLSRVANNQAFFYFNLGAARRDENNEIFFTPRDDNHPITDRMVRRAIGYAIDRLSICMSVNNGMSRPATGILHPFNTGRWIDPTSAGMSIFDLDLANQILDEAGYVMGPDGFRLDLDGNPWYINIAIADSAANQIILPLHMQNFARIGVDLRQYGGTWVDHNVIVSTVTTVFADDADFSPNPEIHAFIMGWNMGLNPNPSTLWGHSANFNMGRFTNPTFQAALADIVSMEAWDEDFLAGAYRRWADAFEYYLPAIYQDWPMRTYVVNNRVSGITLHRGARLNPEGRAWHRIGLTAEQPYVD